jgi:hypothetical protein
MTSFVEAAVYKHQPADNQRHKPTLDQTGFQLYRHFYGGKFESMFVLTASIKWDFKSIEKQSQILKKIKS